MFVRVRSPKYLKRLINVGLEFLCMLVFGTPPETYFNSIKIAYQIEGKDVFKFYYHKTLNIYGFEL